MKNLGWGEMGQAGGKWASCSVIGGLSLSLLWLNISLPISLLPPCSHQTIKKDGLMVFFPEVLLGSEAYFSNRKVKIVF
jgi:hypothetical protein